MNYTLSKAALLWGALFGLLAPIVGLFLGLQVSVVIANVLLWPALLMSSVLGAPLGTWNIWLMLGGMLVSVLVWALVFGIAHLIYKKLRA